MKSLIILLNLFVSHGHYQFKMNEVWLLERGGLVEV